MEESLKLINDPFVASHQTTWRQFPPRVLASSPQSWPQPLHINSLHHLHSNNNKKKKHIEPVSRSVVKINSCRVHTKTTWRLFPPRGFLSTPQFLAPTNYNQQLYTIYTVNKIVPVSGSAVKIISDRSSRPHQDHVETIFITCPVINTVIPGLN